LALNNSDSLKKILKDKNTRYFGFENSPLSIAEPMTGQIIMQNLKD
jgi:hypothetical protein